MRPVYAVAGLAGLVGCYLLIRRALSNNQIVNLVENSDPQVPGFSSDKNAPVTGNPLTGGIDYLDFDFNELFYPWGQAKPAPTKPIETGEVTVMPRGIANNNPLNIRENEQSDFDWVGEQVNDVDPSFEEFTSAFYGIRAAARTLKTYRDKYGLNTVAGVVSRWAPPSDNNPTQKYIEFVASKSGVTPNQVLNVSNYPKVVAAMIHFENGFNPYELSEITSAVNAGFK